MKDQIKIKSGFDYCEGCKKVQVQRRLFSSRYVCDKCKEEEMTETEVKMLKKYKKETEKRDTLIKSLKGKTVLDVKIKTIKDWQGIGKVVNLVVINFTDGTKIKINSCIDGWYDDAISFMELKEGKHK